MRTLTDNPIWSLTITWVLFVPLLFFVARGSFSFDRAQSGTLGAAESSAVTDTRSDSVFYRAEQLMVYAVVGIVIAAFLPRLSGTIQQNLTIFSLPCFALLSALWSQSLSKTIPFGLFTLVLTLFGVYLATRFAPERQVELFYLVGWASIVLSLLAVLLFPNAGIAQADGLGAWRGMFVQKNVCGETTILMAYVALVVKPKSWLGQLGVGLYLALVTVIVIMSQSRTAWIIYALSVGFFLFLKAFSRIAWREKILVAGTLIVLGAVAGSLVVANMSSLAILLGKDPTLTGRTKIWAAVMTAIWKHPVLGYGYRAFWLAFKGESRNVGLAVGATGLSNSENAVLETWLELGITGVVIMFGVLLQASRNAFTCLRARAPKYVYWYILILFFNLLALVDGNKIMFPHTIEWLLLVVAYVGLAREARRLRNQSTRWA